MSDFEINAEAMGDKMITLISKVDQLTESFESLNKTVSGFKYNSDIDKYGKGFENTATVAGKAADVIQKSISVLDAGSKIEKYIQGYQEAKVALSLFKLENEGMTVSQGVLNGTLKASEGAVGMFSSALSANPIGATIALVGALTVGIAALSGAFKDMGTSQLKQDLAGLNESMDKYRDTMSQMAETRKSSIESGMSEMGYYQGLKAELDGIVDANGRVKAGYEDRAGFILNTLNEALGTEMEINSGIIDNYGQMSESIDSMIQKKKAEMILSAYEEEYAEAIKNRAAAYEALVKQQEMTAIAEAEYQEAIRTGSDATVLAKLNALNKSRDAEEQFAADLEESTRVISNYEAMQADAYAGNTDKIVATMGMREGAYYDLTSLSKSKTEEQIALLEKERDEAERLSKERGDAVYANDVRSYDERIKGLKEHLSEMETSVYGIKWDETGKYIVNGMMVGVDTREGAMVTKFKNMADNIIKSVNFKFGINSPSKVMAEKGRFLVMGLANGIEKNSAMIKGAMNDMTDEVLNNAPDMDMLMSSSLASPYISSRYITESAMTNTLIADFDKNGGMAEALLAALGRVTLNNTLNIDGRQCAEVLTPLIDKNMAAASAMRSRGAI
nr:MAG TPA: hypothetical protein [Caudoviricetes sp.]